tara:strand:- start:2359 stop:2727 length:369 start_codon:yes stop_codon:yes gene_type:complete
MADLKILNLNKNSDKFIFKKKLSLRRKSKRKLINESFIMFSISILIIYLNYLIPNKLLIFKNLLENFIKLSSNIFNSLTYSYQIFLAFFIIISSVFSLILLLGAFSRLIKVLNRKSKQITYK